MAKANTSSYLNEKEENFFVPVTSYVSPWFEIALHIHLGGQLLSGFNKLKINVTFGEPLFSWGGGGRGALLSEFYGI